MNAKVISYILPILLVCSACVRQKTVEVTQTFRVENQTNDTWRMEEKVVWGGVYADSASIEIPPMQSDSVQHNFVLNKGGSAHIFYVLPESLEYWYYHKICRIKTRLVNLTTQETYEMEECLLPSNYYNPDAGERPPYWWTYDGEDDGPMTNNDHTFKCVICQELFEQK